MKINSIAIVMPVYNEQDNIRKVLKDWLRKIKLFNFKKFKFIIINDGSTDSTLENIKKVNSKYFKIINTKNKGHGNACLTGYKFALKNNYEWVFQIDSDGQCNPRYFSSFVKKSKKNSVIYGYRFKRNDGYLRLVFTKILSIMIFLKTSHYVKDSNVPYRLIKASYLELVVKKIPKKLILKNILITIRLKKFFNNISYVPIIFNKRISGVTKYNFTTLLAQLKNLMFYI